MKDPNTILVYEGQHLAERHLAEQVTLISAENESVTILMDGQTHLPLQRVFQWRDPEYHDKNTDTEEYDDYHLVNESRLPTPLRKPRTANWYGIFTLRSSEVQRRRCGDFWNPDKAAITSRSSGADVSGAARLGHSGYTGCGKTPFRPRFERARLQPCRLSPINPRRL